MSDKPTSGIRSRRSRAVAAPIELTPPPETRVENGRTVPAEVRSGRADTVRSKAAGSGISEAAIADATHWARSTE